MYTEKQLGLSHANNISKQNQIKLHEFQQYQLNDFFDHFDFQEGYVQNLLDALFVIIRDLEALCYEMAWHEKIVLIVIVSEGQDHSQHTVEDIVKLTSACLYLNLKIYIFAYRISQFQKIQKILQELELLPNVELMQCYDFDSVINICQNISEYEDQKMQRLVMLISDIQQYSLKQCQINQFVQNTLASNQYLKYLSILILNKNLHEWGLNPRRKILENTAIQVRDGSYFYDGSQDDFGAPLVVLPRRSANWETNCAVCKCAIPLLLIAAGIVVTLVLMLTKKWK